MHRSDDGWIITHASIERSVDDSAADLAVQALTGPNGYYVSNNRSQSFQFLNWCQQP
jgi:hypothetical protein